MNDGQSVPTGVKVIAVLYYIYAVFGIIVGLLFLVGAGASGSIPAKIPVLSGLGVLVTVLFIVGGIILIGLGVFGFFVGRGLWKARPWARIVAIIFAVLGILIAIIFVRGSIANNIVNLVIHLVIGGYLLFSKNVKEAFA